MAATNIRAHNFGIPLETAFKIKEMAGKIVPAISSSNALVASMQVHEAIKLLERNDDQIRGSTYSRLNKQERLSSVCRKRDIPNPSCPVCRDDSLSICTVEIESLAKITLKDFVNTILPEKLGISNSKLFLMHGREILYERDDELSDEEMYAKRLDKTLDNLKLACDSIIGLQA